MKLLRLAATLAALLPLAAAAQDLTATYRIDAGRNPETRIEIAANGDLRIDLGDRGYLLSHDGVDYLVTPGPGGPVATRVDDIAAANAARPPKPSPLDAEPAPRGTLTVNGRTGAAYGMPPRGDEALPAFLVVSNDPELAPIGRAVHHLLTMHAASDPDFGAGFKLIDALLGTGTPLRLLPIGDLVAVNHDPIPASHFLLTVPPRLREEVMAEYAPDLDQAELTDPGGHRMIKRAVFDGATLWLLADNGTMTRIDSRKQFATVATPPHALDLCRANGAPVIVAGDSTRWTLQRWGGTRWEPWRTIAAHGDELVGLHCTGDRYDLLTSRRLIAISSAGEQAVTLSKPIRASLIASLYDDGAALFAGSDAGEWGGGLIRIDRATGIVTQIERRGPGACAGPLNAACDPVNGIGAEPGKPGCLLAAIGLQHFRPTGHLVEICGDRIATYYAKPYTLDPDWHFDPAAPEPRMSVPFYGMAESRGALWIAGLDGLYRIDAAGVLRFARLPVFEEVGGIRVSFALPSMVLVQTSINARQSIGGPGILLAPR